MIEHRVNATVNVSHYGKRYWGTVVHHEPSGTWVTFEWKGREILRCFDPCKVLTYNPEGINP